MDGIQKTVALALKDVARKVEEGLYGEGDDFAGNETAEKAFLEDVEEATDKRF